MVQAGFERRPALHHAGEIETGAEAAARRLLCFARTRAGKGRILPARGKAHHHAHQLAKYLSAGAADAAGYPDAAWRHHRHRAGPQRAGQGRVPSERTPVRGLARLLRRNPTDAERALWAAMVKDRRFAGRGFKRQVPLGPHICDFVSFPLRAVIDLTPDRETEAARQARADKRAWLIARGYALLDIAAAEVESALAPALDRLASKLQELRAPGHPESSGGAKIEN